MESGEDCPKKPPHLKVVDRDVKKGLVAAAAAAAVADAYIDNQ